jgi:hypothetical protein
MAELAHPLGVNLPRGSAETIFDEMAEVEAPFRGLKYGEIARYGTILSAAQPVGAS